MTEAIFFTMVVGEKEDRNELIFCYGLTDEEADQVCNELAEIEDAEAGNNVEK